MDYPFERYRIISFDCFDTLLHRRVSPPEMIKYKTAVLAVQLLAQKGITLTEHQFQAQRDQQEKSLREENSSRQLDAETHIIDIFRKTLYAISGRHYFSVCHTLVEYEIENECRYLYLATGVKALLSTIQKKGLRIVVTSDTYLNTHYLVAIFEKFGISQYITQVYASCEYNVSKYSGSLYKKIMTDYHVAPNAILHIGDNKHADYHMANKKHLDAILLNNPNVDLQYRRQNHYADYAMPMPSPFPDELLPKSPHKPVLEKAITDNIAPAFFSFAYQALLDIHRLGIKKVFFVAREGIILEKMFRKVLNECRIFQRMSTNLEFHILYSSRRASATYPLLHVDSPLIASTLMYFYRTIKLNDFLDFYAIDKNALSDQAQKIVAQNLDTEGYDKFIDIMQSTCLGKEINTLLKLKHKIAKAYLQQQGVLCEQDIALVDIGWLARAQKRIADVTDYQQTIYGFYALTDVDIDKDMPKNAIAYPGYICNQSTRNELLRYRDACALLEAMLGAPDLGNCYAYGYDKTTNKISPKFNPVTKKQHNHIQNQQFLLDGIEQTIKQFNDSVYHPTNLQQIFQERLKRLLFYPDKKIIPHFSQYMISNDSHSSDDYSIIPKAKLSMMNIAFPSTRTGQFAFFWVQGFMKQQKNPIYRWFYSVRTTLLTGHKRMVYKICRVLYRQYVHRSKILRRVTAINAHHEYD